MPRNAYSKLTGFLRQGGFTLVELMIVVVILGIIAAVAFPAYTNFVRQARRADAQTHLTEIAGRQEKFYANNLRYASSLEALGYAAPYPSIDGHYRITGMAWTGQTYSLTAAPTPGGLQTRRDGHPTPAHNGIRPIPHGCCTRIKTSHEGCYGQPGRA